MPDDAHEHAARMRSWASNMLAYAAGTQFFEEAADGKRELEATAAELERLAERADRATELLRSARAVQIIALHLTGETWTGAWCGDQADDPRLIARIDAYLAEVDRAE